MRVTIDINPNIEEDEVIIRQRTASENNELVQKIMSVINEKNSTIVVYKKDTEYFVDIKNILFFESDANFLQVHAKDDLYVCKYKLYEIEAIMPKNFVRISKSTILNIDYVMSIERNLTSSSLVELMDTYKKVYVSRAYYKDLKQKIIERRIIR